MGKPKGDTVLNNNGGSVTKVQKTDRKSRNGKGRGLPKKGGAGGKHTWGALGSELFAEVMASSQDDPNYDSDSQTPTLLLPVDVKEEIPAALVEEKSEPEPETETESPVVLQPVEVPPTTSIRVRRISDLNRI